MTGKYRLLFVSHTHWDREWYLPFQGFRYRLVESIDLLLDILRSDPRFHSFMLDGQSCVLEDYLEIRPEKEHELRKWIEAGRILVGPSYIQPDEFIVGEESLVRNLLIGIRVARRYGRVLLAGYYPDIFGHTAQLPQILRGFGIDSFFFMRGMGDEGEKLGVEFRWRGPDGSEVLASHLRRGYCNAVNFPSEPEKMLKKIEDWKRSILPYSKTGIILAMNGCDHQPPQKAIPDILEKLQELLKKEAEVEHGTLLDYIEELRKIRDQLKTYEGELRGGRYQPILTGVWSTRSYLKQENRAAELFLTMVAEPLATIVWLLDGGYPSSFLEKAWKLLLQTHPHDSICGCSVDDVHKECMTRLASVRHIAEMVAYKAAQRLLDKLNLPPGEDVIGYIVVFNPLLWPRTDIVETVVAKTEGFFKIVGPDEGEIPYQLHGVDDPYVSNKFNFDFSVKPGYRWGDYKRISFIARNVPPLGYKVYKVIRSKEQPGYAPGINVSEEWVENRFFKVKAVPEEGGSLTVVDKRSGRVYKRLNLLEDSGDAGDEYDYSPPREDTVFTSRILKADVEIVEKGPVRARIRVKLTMQLPDGLTEDRRARSSRLVENPVVFDIMVYSDVPRIDIVAKVFNRSRDHRLRAVFPSGSTVDKTYTHTHFYIIERSLEIPSGEGWVQRPQPTCPQQHWVDVNDGAAGLAVANRGLVEYEARKEEKGITVLVTLIRAVGWLSRPDLLTRPYNAGPSIPTPDAQMIGDYEFKYSIIPHVGSWENAYRQGTAFAVPLTAVFTKPRKTGCLPAALSFVSVEPHGVVFTTFKKAEDENTAILRFYNPFKKSVNLRLKTPGKVGRIWLANLNEDNLRELSRNTDGASLKVGGCSIVTLKILP